MKILADRKKSVRLQFAKSEAQLLFDPVYGVKEITPIQF